MLAGIMMKMKVLVIDDTLGELRFVQQLLEQLERVGEVMVADFPQEVEGDSFVPDVLIVGPRWLASAREFRERFPGCYMVGRCPWQGELEGEFFPWGNSLREPSLPITSLIPS